MAKQINNFKKAQRDRIECEKMFSKTQLQFVDLPALITGTPPPPTVISVDELKCFQMLINLPLALNMQICFS